MSVKSFTSCGSDELHASFRESSGASFADLDITFTKCPKCLTEYDFIRRSGQVNCRLPLILKCKHTVCEDCISKLHHAGCVVCPICSEASTVPRDKQNKTNNFFPLHYALIGYLVSARSVKKDAIAWKSSKPTNTRKVSKAAPTEIAPFEQCEDHNIPINVQCNDCKIPVCSFCFLEQHANHSASYLHKLKPNEASEFEWYKRQAFHILKELKVSQQKASELNNFDISYVERDVRYYFAGLHAKLHCAEHEICEKLSTIQLGEVDVDLDATNEMIGTSIERVEKTLRICETANDKEINIRALFEELKAIRDLPCQFIVAGAKAPISFVGSLDLNDIEHLFTVESSADISHSFTPISDWENIELPKTQVLSKLHLTKPNNSQQRLSTEKNMQASPVPQFDSKSNSTFLPDENKKVTWHKIIITHLNDLNSFFVQKHSTQTAINELNSSLSKKLLKEPTNITLNGLYTILYKVKNLQYWRRGKVIEIIPNDNDSLFKVFFIDYGNVQIIPPERIKCLDPVNRKREPFAIECKLSNPDGLLFNETSHLRLLEMIAGQNLELKVDKVLPNKRYEVDLMLKKSNGAAISIKKLLPTTEIINLQSHKETPVLFHKLFKNSKDFTVGNMEQVIVSYLRDPSYICVQLYENLESINKMSFELLNYYTKPGNCIPMEDTDVIVNYPNKEHGLMHRATVKQVNTSQRTAEVFFVDWGKTEIVPWSSINFLAENFTRMECQCITVKLADIERCDPNAPWPASTSEFLQNFIRSNNHLKMLITKTNPLEVLLFQPTPGSDVCLNALLVDNNYAVSTGTGSETVCWPIHYAAEPVSEPDPTDFATQTVKKSEELLITCENPHTSLKNAKTLQVDIVHCKSPSLIFIKFAKNRETEDNLHKELQIHYKKSNNPKSKQKWNESDLCVVYERKENRFYRARVKGVTASGKIDVYLYDHARELKVKRTDIFIQEPYFQKVGCLAYKCCLANIKPAGAEKGKWSQQAIEVLLKIFEGHRDFHVTKCLKQGYDSKLPVVLWYTYTSIGNALEQQKCKLISINQILVESGLALNLGKHQPLIPCEEVPTPQSSLSKSSSESEKLVEVVEVKKKDILFANGDWCSDREIVRTQVKAWPSLMRLRDKTEFDAFFICIDSLGALSIRDAELQEQYLTLESQMNDSFKLVKVPKNRDWRIGDMCSISESNLWYRGTVIDILDDTNITVEMIDFGSEHVVHPKDLRKCVMYQDVPPLLYKVCLYDVHPINGEWTGNHVNKLLSMATDKIHVMIMDGHDEELPSAEIYLSNGLSFNEAIMDVCNDFVRYNRTSVDELEENDSYQPNRSDSSVVCSEKPDFNDDEENEISDFKLQTELLKRGVYDMYIQSVVKYDTVVLSFHEELITICGKNPPIARTLFTEIQKCAPNQPQLTSMRNYHPCVALHSKKKIWCRAMIYSLESFEYGIVQAFLVDYGIFEYCKVSNLKTIKARWLKSTISNVVAKLNFELLEINKAELVAMKLNQLTDEKVHAYVIDTNPLVVNLLQKGEYCYEDLVKSKVLKMLKGSKRLS